MIESILRKIYRKWISPKVTFSTSATYWQNRYKTGGHSGDGSYGKLAVFKAQVINDFVEKNNIKTVIEYGCGDGNQLKLAKYPSYIGFDISGEAINLCQKLFKNDSSKSFKSLNNQDKETAELTLSLDVIFHLIEEDVFNVYMQRLFDSSKKCVIIYSSNTDKNQVKQAPHFKNRHFSKWVETHRSNWKLIAHIPNQFPFTGDEVNESVSDFYVYTKT